MSRFFRGGAAFAKPENALKRAEELINVGQKPAALQALHDVITSKRYRTWQKPLELIMFKYVDLCVEMKKGRYAKDGLIHYRNICQNVNVTSLEEVIKYFLKAAHEKAEQAQAAADAATIDVEDLEDAETPEDIMLSYVSGDKSKDRTDRELVTPWFKFLWESYRNTLDVLRNNNRLEALYALVVQKAFAFCLQYKRNTEFRRLCDILRNHLANLGKYREQRDRPDLTLPDSLQLYLETRFEQLRVACELELWQEAFRSVEDIQGLLTYSKKPIRRDMMAVYYARLTQIFTRSGAHMYNGYAWYKLYNHEKVYNKRLTPEDIKVMASCVVLAAVSILPYQQARLTTRPEGSQDNEAERAARMATILALPLDTKSDAKGALSRSGLITDVSAKSITALALDEVKDIYNLLEAEFDPLELCQKLAPLLEKLGELPSTLSGAAPMQTVDFGFFRNAVQRVAALKALRQLGGVYSVMTIEHLATLVPFMSFDQLEQLVVDGVKYGYLQAKLDHKNGTVQFGALTLESDRLRSHVSTLAARLASACHMINPAPPADVEDRRLKLVRAALATAEQEHRRSIARKELIERRKEEAERQLLEKEREEEAKKAMAERLTAEAEEKRREEERKKRELERITKILQEQEEQEIKAREEAAKKQGTRIELERKLGKMLKQMDHFERAKREEEAPMLKEAYAKTLAEDEEYHRAEQVRFLEKHRVAWQTDVQEKGRLVRMQADRLAFESAVKARRAEEFEALKRAHEERLAEKRAQRRMERDFRRKQEYVRRCRIMIEEKRRKEEEEAIQLEEEKRARERAEQERRLQEIAEQQRKREEEIERRMKEEKERLLTSRPAEPEAAAAPRPSGGSGYVPPSRRSDGPAPAAGAAPPRRDEPERWGSRAPEREEPAPARPSGGAGGGYVPPSRRGTAAPSSGGSFAPSSRRDDGPGAPPAAGGGGAWRPSRGREDAPKEGGADRWGPAGRRDDGPAPAREAWAPRRGDGPGPRARDDGPPPPRKDAPRW